MTLSRKRFALILLLTFSVMPQLAWALDCSEENIVLATQEDINNFQSTYGNGGICDSITGSLNIGNDYVNPQSDITDLGGLLDIKEIGGNLRIWYNLKLTNVDGLSSLKSIGSTVSMYGNDSLSNCAGLSRVFDQWDDAIPGPGPGEAGIPDIGYAVHVQDNLDGCNSIQEILAGVNISNINPGLNDAWFDPNTDGQGFLISVFKELGIVTLAWFTYDTELPSQDAKANLGDPGHRWLTAVGPIVDNQVLMDIEMTSGGLFDTATEIQRTDPPGSDGTIRLTFNSCNSGTVEYDIPSVNRQGTVPIQRVADDNIVHCEALISE